MDALWLKIVELIFLINDGLDFVFAPLNTLGPGPAIFCIALVTAAFTRILSKFSTTKRYRQLQEEFNYWYSIRQQALTAQGSDPEKSELLARDIDKARLNKIYYDYFFEGLLLNLGSTYIPLLCMLGYVNHAYRPEKLQILFQQDYVFKFGGASGDPLLVGSAFWFVISVVVSYIFIYLAKKMYFKYASGSKKISSKELHRQAADIDS